MIKRAKFDQINVIPLVDIVLVLLVIVLSTSTFLSSSIKINLPSAPSKAKKSTTKAISITITKDNKIFIDKSSVDLDELKNRVSAHNHSQKYLIRGDSKSSFESFVQVVAIFKTLGIKNVSIATKE